MNHGGIIFDISRFCVHDGPGIRTTVFLKGCPLRCAWCHNPESQKMSPEIMLAPERCAGCGACVNACAAGLHRLGDGHIYDRAACTGCGLCAAVCPTEALRIAGRRSTAADIMKEVLRDRAFYEESGGGITVSGGEPMMQPDFLQELLLLARQEGVHTCVETCGHAPEAAFRKIAPLVDLFLYDWKESDPEKHLSYTGADNRLILSNLEYLSRCNADIILRLPFIPGYNDTKAHLAGIAALANRHPRIRRIEIMPYHPLGVSKAQELGRAETGDALPEIPGKQLLETVLNELRGNVSADVEICT